jgi:MFS family permease
MVPLMPIYAQQLGAALLLLLAAQLLVMTASGIGNMGRSLEMNDLKYSISAMTTTAAFGSLLTLPLPLILGWLSDRVGRKAILIIGYLCGAAGILALISAQKLWQFWFSAALLSMVAVCMSVSPAFVADIVKRGEVGTGVSLSGNRMQVGLAFASSAGILASILIMAIRLPQGRGLLEVAATPSA